MPVAEKGIAQNVARWDLCPETHAFRVISVAPPALSAMDVEKALAQSITERTAGRVHMLQVEMLGNRIVLRGCATSYHAVQLAVVGLQESLKALRLDRPERVELDFDVSRTAACAIWATKVSSAASIC